MPDQHDDDPNDTGRGAHNPRYDSEYLKEHIEWQALQPMSPYDEIDPNERWLSSKEPGLPPFYPRKPLPYEPLQQPRWIRVLKLEPGYVYMKVRCSLLHINLDDKDHLQYEALSYTWGQYYDNPKLDGKARDQRIEVIICNDVWIDVTRSLYHALQMYRRADRARVLWADALCINQEDLEEKNHQVSMMQNIYKEAFHVLVWVGYRDPKVVKKTMDLICRIVNQEYSEEARHGVQATWYNEQSILEIPGTPERPGPESPSSVYEDDLPDEPPPRLVLDTYTLSPLADLFQARYWSRLWVFQEIALSKLTTMCWSQARIRFEWVALVAQLIEQRYMSEFYLYSESITALHNCATMYEAWRGDYADRPFLELLMHTGNFKATDPRDKVFGLLGVKTVDTNPENGQIFQEPNYNVSQYEVFLPVAEKVLVIQKDMRCLALVAPLTEVPEGQVSWVPDFSQPQASVFYPTLCTNTQGYTHASIARPQNCVGLPCLPIEGLSVDTIRTTSDMGVPQWLRIDGITRIQRLIHEFKLQHDDVTVALCLTAGFNTDMRTTVVDKEAHAAALRAFSQWRLDDVVLDQNVIMPPLDSASADTKVAYKFFQGASIALSRQELFRTEQGMLGIGPRRVAEGDIVAVLFGASTPYVLRRKRDHYQIVGPSYVCGLMEGQAVESWKKSGEKATIFHII